MRKGWDYKKLGEVCAPKTDILRANKLFHKDDVIEYIDISSIDNCAHSITQPTRFLFYEAPSRAQQKVEQGDILYSLVRPNLKNIAVVTSSDTDKYVASSGFCVLRSKEVDHRYLYHLVLSNPFNDYIMGLVSGANYPAVREDDIKGFSFRCPPIADQQRIVAELDKINELISLKKAQLSDLDTLAQSIFYEMFGDPIENEKGWEVKKLGEIAAEKLSYGSGASAIEYDGETRYVRITDITDGGELDANVVSPNVFDNKYLLNDGDILFARSGATVGKTFLYKPKYGRCIYAGYLIRYVPDKKVVSPLYVFSFTKTNYYKSFISSSQRTVAQPNINAKQYGDLLIPLPPLSLQKSFARKIEAIEQQKAQIAATIKDLETLLASRMQYWFD